MIQAHESIMESAASNHHITSVMDQREGLGATSRTEDLTGFRVA